MLTLPTIPERGRWLSQLLVGDTLTVQRTHGPSVAPDLPDVYVAEVVRQGDHLTLVQVRTADVGGLIVELFHNTAASLTVDDRRYEVCPSQLGNQAQVIWPTDADRPRFELALGEARQRASYMREGHAILARVDGGILSFTVLQAGSYAAMKEQGNHTHLAPVATILPNGTVELSRPLAGLILTPLPN